MDLPFVKITAWTLQSELEQLKDEDKESSVLTKDAFNLIGSDFNDPRVKADAELWMLRAHAQQPRADSAWVEPTHWEEIHRESDPVGAKAVTYGRAELRSRLAGAWLGRAAGCLLGKPFSGLVSDQAWPLLKESGNWPLSRLIRLSELPADKVDQLRRRQPTALEGLAGGRDFSPEDQDMDFTVLVLTLLERHGTEFTPDDTARLWLELLPVLRISGAERAAYRNLLQGFDPPETATYMNPCREWSGAMMRSDHFGWVCPGDPSLASYLALKDASVSHSKNGIYASMWLAAMNAAAFTSSSMEEIIDAGLGVVPRKSRLYASLGEVKSWHEEGMSHDAFLEKLHTAWNEKHDHDWGHSISNSMIILAALLWGEGDYRRSVGLAVQSLLDADSNAASVGAIIGVWRGEDGLPDDYIHPLETGLTTGLLHQAQIEFSDLVDRSLALHSPLSL